MMKATHDLELGPRPELRDFHALVHGRREDPLLLGIMHYLRDEAAGRLGDSKDARRAGNVAVADMEQGAQDWLEQVLMKFEGFREQMPPEPEAGA